MPWRAAEPRRLVEESAVLLPGPWQHRWVSANGIRLHVAEAGDGPLLVLLHGFPQFWWAWRHQMPALAAAGYRVVAPDLRGYGASDKPPRGYDVPTLADDVVGLVRALGYQRAHLVGHDWGGLLALTVAVQEPGVVDRLALLGTAHPLALRDRIAAVTGGQLAAIRLMGAFQLPWRPERWLVADDAAAVGRLLRDWGGPGYPDAEAEQRYRQAMQILFVPNRAFEYFRWAFRSRVRPDGHRYTRMMAVPPPVATLQIHGVLDRWVLPGTARASGRYLSAPYEWHLLPDVGHFVAEEAADQVTGLLLDFVS
jgi:pimeloyl-ACP methyl ester carboxylesterase